MSAIPEWDGDDLDAFDLLETGFRVSRGGIIYPVSSDYTPDITEWSAINYLCEEWDYGYSKEKPDA